MPTSSPSQASLDIPVEQNICSLRAFFRFLFGEGIISTDFASKMPMVKARKQTSIPSVWTKEERDLAHRSNRPRKPKRQA